jgi:hypothetical protein
MMASMTDVELLRFEEQHPGRDALKERALYSAGVRPVRYYQRLLNLIDQPWVVKQFPAVTARARRLRDAAAERRRLRL